MKPEGETVLTIFCLTLLRDSGSIAVHAWSEEKEK
jgi:hypothetical protein